MFQPRYEATTLPPREPPGRGGRGIEAFPLHFSGTGYEYFRVWIANLLLTIVTLGLYAPWARRRTARYFYSRTEVAQSPLEFTGPLHSMVLGFVLLGAAYVGYSALDNAGHHGTSRLLVTCAVLLSPWMWASAMRFRLASTRWRGIHLHFLSTWSEVYLASWPVLALLVLGMAVGALLPLLSPAGPGAVLALLLGSLALAVGCVARLDFNRRRLLVNSAWIGDQPGNWKPGFTPFLKAWLGAAGLLLAGLATVAGLAALAVWSRLGTDEGRVAALLRVSGLFIPGALAVLAVLAGLTLTVVPTWAWLQAKLFQLTWNGTGISAVARFRSELSVGRYVRLCLANALLTQLTLGLYRPFARVAAYRMKLESVTLHVKGSLGQLAGRLAEAEGGLGDAAADAMGLDLVG